MSPTEQARGDSGKEPKLPLRQNGEKNLGRNQAQSGGQFSSGQDIIVYSLFTYCFNYIFKCINVLYFYFYIVAISNNNSIM